MSDFKNFPLHPLCTLFPRIDGDDFNSLVSDIKLNGLRNPIITHDGMILDGGNRYRACIEAGIAPIFSIYSGESVVDFVLSANLHRRHMTPGQRAAIVASTQDWSKAQAVGQPGKVSGKIARLNTRADRAAVSGVGDGTQKMADKIAKESPELAKQVGRGEKSLPQAAKELRRVKLPDKTPNPVDDPSIEHDNPDDYGPSDAELAEITPDDIAAHDMAEVEQSADDERKRKAMEEDFEAFVKLLDSKDPLAEAVEKRRIAEERYAGMKAQNNVLIKAVKRLQARLRKANLDWSV